MAKTGKLDNKEVLELLTPYTQDVLSEFLMHYKTTSHAQYKGAISHLFYFLGKDDVRKLDMKDFNSIQEYYKNKKRKGPQDKYVEAFFKYAFAKDILEVSDGFEKIWIKEDCKQHFKRLLKQKPQKEVYVPSLTIEQISEIEELLSKEYENIDMLKISFIWYMLFHTECGVNELKFGSDATKYNNGRLETNNGIYKIPKRFEPLMLHLQGIEYHGFNVNGLVSKLGKIVGIDSLKPQAIKAARKQNILKCSQCGKEYTNIKDNWVSVNNRIICVHCSEKIKKNCKIKIEPVRIEILRQISIADDINLESIIFTFEELKNKLPKEIDYLKLHEYQMHIGKLGEAYVYDFERKRLLDIGSEYYDDVDNIPSKDHNCGYDILSYDEDGTEIFIEVKTEAFDKGNDFFMTANELKKAKELISKGKKYYIYRVQNVLKNQEDIKLEIIKNILSSSQYKIEPYVYKVSKLNT